MSTLKFGVLFFLLTRIMFLGAFMESNIHRWKNHVRKLHNSKMTKTATNPISPGTHLVLWRGEGTKGYCLQFRQLELQSAYEASTMNEGHTRTKLSFHNALPVNTKDDDMFEALQYINAPSMNDIGALRKAANRSALVRHLYCILSTGKSYEELVSKAINSNTLIDLQSDSSRSWCLRLHQYDNISEKGIRFGVSKRSSLAEEKKALREMSNLLQTFKGPVKLKSPQHPIYIFRGLKSDGEELVMAERVASSIQTSLIAPKTRICVTRTPLCPLAAVLLCNLSKLKDGETVLDPFSGSCSSLLAAAMVVPSCKSVGIEIVDDSIVNRKDILQDFETRNLQPPLALIKGDCSDLDIRDQAKRFVGKEGFDVILADPPYGRREKIHQHDVPPLIDLVRCIANDLKLDRPLLNKSTGRLVSFVPNSSNESIHDSLPSADDLSKANLEMTSLTEQPLSETLSRWLVVYQSKM
jgi:tRNA G10  N-methylase Trm11